VFGGRCRSLGALFPNCRLGSPTAEHQGNRLVEDRERGLALITTGTQTGGRSGADRLVRVGGVHLRTALDGLEGRRTEAVKRAGTSARSRQEIAWREHLGERCCDAEAVVSGADLLGRISWFGGLWARRIRRGGHRDERVGGLLVVAVRPGPVKIAA